MSKQIQPRFQLLVNDVDVTNSVTDEVSFKEEPNIISTLSFTLTGNKYSIGVSDVIKIGDRITFFGGTFGNSLIKPFEENYRLFFSGNVKNLNPNYTETGKIKVTIEAVDTGYVAYKEKINFAYPSLKAVKRTWANVKELKPSEIFRNIVEKELNLSVGTIQILQDSSISYTLKNPIFQAGINDWKFLRKLAEQCGCDIFSNVKENGKNEISIIDKGSQKYYDDKKVRFIYPLRENVSDVKQNTFVTPIINNIDGVVDIPVLELSLTQDLTLFHANKRVVEVFDPKSGDTINVIQTYDELTATQKQENTKAKNEGKPEPYKVSKIEGGKQFVLNYYRLEVDETKLPTDPKERKELKSLALKVATQEGTDGNVKSFDDIKQYFKRAEFLDPRFKVIDEPYVGIDVTAKIRGEVFLKNQRSYPIIGIQRYGSDKINDSYHLRVITHTWSDEGYTNQLEFKL